MSKRVSSLHAYLHHIVPKQEQLLAYL